MTRLFQAGAVAAVALLAGIGVQMPSSQAQTMNQEPSTTQAPATSAPNNLTPSAQGTGQSDDQNNMNQSTNGQGTAGQSNEQTAHPYDAPASTMGGGGTGGANNNAGGGSGK